MHEKFFTGIQINVFALAVLAIIMANIRKRPDREESTQKIYWGMAGFTALMIVLDIAFSVLNGKSGQNLRRLHVVVEMADYILAPTLGALWALYAEAKIDREGGSLKKTFRLLSVPLIINAIIVFMDMGIGRLFYIDESNIYHRGELFWIPVFVSYMYLVYATIRVLKNRKNIRRSDYHSLLLFPLPPFIGGLIQVAFYGVTLMWTSVTLSVLVIFINIQNDQLNRDHLTGLYNRRQLERFLSSYIKYGDRKKPLGGIMIDVNDFKKINDEHGHVEGDRALEHLGDILLESFRKEDFVARYAGDEFVVLSSAEDRRDLESMIFRLKETICNFNESKVVPYDIEISIGYDILDRKIHSYPDLFIKHIDELMYEHKNI